MAGPAGGGGGASGGRRGGGCGGDGRISQVLKRVRLLLGESGQESQSRPLEK